MIRTPNEDANDNDHIKTESTAIERPEFILASMEPRAQLSPSLLQQPLHKTFTVKLPNIWNFFLYFLTNCILTVKFFMMELQGAL